MLPEPISPELALVLPAAERRAALAALAEPSSVRIRPPAWTPPPSPAPADDGARAEEKENTFTGPRLIGAALAYALARAVVAGRSYAIIVVPVVALIIVLSLIR